MTRFFVNRNQIDGNTAVITDEEDIYHFQKVLRARRGDEVEISDNERYEYDCRVREINGDEIILDIAGRQEFQREAKVRVTLFQGVPRAGKMDDIIRKCVELGAAGIVPVRTARADVPEKKSGSLGNRLVRWRRIALEAAKQSRRGRIPEVGSVITSAEMYEALRKYDFVVWPYEEEKNRSIKERLKKIPESARSIAVVIGPEGGFAPEEAERLNIYEPVSLGKSILRTETAGIAAVSMIMYELEL